MMIQHDATGAGFAARVTTRTTASVSAFHTAA